MNKIIYFDFETSDINPTTCLPLQIAAAVVDVEDSDYPILDGGLFVSYILPHIENEDGSHQPIEESHVMDINFIKDSALKKNGIKREDILGFPDEKVVWDNFAKFCGAFKHDGELPVPSGWNILNYDLIICDRLNKRYKTKRYFHENNTIDLMNLDWIFRRKDLEYSGRSFDAARLHFGLTLEDEEQTHTADVDVKQGVKLLRRYLQFIDKQAKRNKYFKGAFNVK